MGDGDEATRASLPPAALRALVRLLNAVQPMRMTFDGDGGKVSPYVIRELDGAIEQAKQAVAKSREIIGDEL